MCERRVWRLALLHLALRFSCTVNFAARAHWRLRRTSAARLLAAWDNEMGVWFHTESWWTAWTMTEIFGGLQPISATLVLLHGIECCSVVTIVGLSLCFEAGHRRWNNKHTAAETFRQWLLSDLHHKSLHRHPNRIISSTRARALTQMHMCPCTLHTLRKTLSKHLFRATGNPNTVKPQSICVDPALISSFLATYRGSTKL